MKSKKLLALIIVVAVLIVIIVVFVSVFAVRNARIVIRSFDGGEITAVNGDPTPNDILEYSKGKSIVFLSKDKLAEELNKKYPEWHVVQVVKHFPNTVEVHMVKRVAVVKLDIDGGVYLDSFGYVVDAPSDGSKPLDVTSAIRDLPGTTAVNAKGQKFRFVSDACNKRLDLILRSIMALWQCKIEIKDIPTILNESDVFTFAQNGNMEILTKTNVKIVVESPSSETLSDGLIKAFSVYYNDKQNLQQQGVDIIVKADGRVTTSNHKD
ncbi:MAG: FtsQ-type POTRA domain-containing protein [Corallococcus sp.]|nr:FtsQ-type POTRA domain-containing protein [Corallococcus sp.]MCM1359276.1 FtsQ-type POTRA domain-containing protein [Corallococcus sp.]MCM1394668.1 FtsQ-type POTRA domain-containing protein [Corallococcus sp.]